MHSPSIASECSPFSMQLAPMRIYLPTGAATRTDTTAVGVYEEWGDNGDVPASGKPFQSTSLTGTAPENQAPGPLSVFFRLHLHGAA